MPKPSKLAAKLGLLNAPVSDKASPSPSGRGHSGGSAGSSRIDYPNRKIGMPPRPTRGEPSTSFDVNASEIMQNKIMNDDDKEWYEELFTIMHKNFLKPRFTADHKPSSRSPLRAEPAMAVGINAGLELSLKSCLFEADLLNEPDDTNKKSKKKKKKKTDEFSSVGSGNIAGYTLPLGMSNQGKSARKKNAEINARFFGGGTVIGKL